MSLLTRVVTFGRMIKFSHSVFALPFALAGATLAAARAGITWQQVAWIVVAMVGTRSAAMGFNRLVDREADALNPRTRNRELPRGVIAPGTVVVFVIASSLLLFIAAYHLNRLCLLLSPVALAVVLSYSLLKRWTWASHFVLGLSLGIAPVGAWIAVTGSLDPEPMALTLAVLTWVAGFDIIYACQDYEFDVTHGLYSIPQRIGIGRALIVARGLHLITLASLLTVRWLFDLHLIYLIGVLVVGLMLVYEHSLVTAHDLSHVNVAFFTTNGIISVLYFVFTVVDTLTR